MKKVIDGKVYDTKKADEIASWNNGCSWNDFRHAGEKLYRTAKGNWFVHGEGGPMSEWAESLEGGRTLSDGEGINALTPEEACEWLERHNEADLIQRWFPTSITEA